MNRGLDIPKTTTESVARAIFDGVEQGEEDIFPDPMSQSVAESWRAGAAKGLERQFAAIAESVPVTARGRRERAGRQVALFAVAVHLGHLGTAAGVMLLSCSAR